jgi:hypothetical protein
MIHLTSFISLTAGDQINLATKTTTGTVTGYADSTKGRCIIYKLI